MSQSVDLACKARKWLREPSSCARVVVIATGLSSEHVDLIHHGFSCFNNIALAHIDTADAGFFLGLQGVDCDYCIVVAGELDKRFLRDLPMRTTSIYRIASDTRAERSVLDAVEQVKRLARLCPPSRLENEPANFAAFASAC